MLPNLSVQDTIFSPCPLVGVTISSANLSSMVTMKIRSEPDTSAFNSPTVHDQSRRQYSARLLKFHSPDVPPAASRVRPPGLAAVGRDYFDCIVIWLIFTVTARSSDMSFFFFFFAAETVSSPSGDIWHFQTGLLHPPSESRNIITQSSHNRSYPGGAEHNNQENGSQLFPPPVTHLV